MRGHAVARVAALASPLSLEAPESLAQLLVIGSCLHRPLEDRKRLVPPSEALKQRGEYTPVRL